MEDVVASIETINIFGLGFDIDRNVTERHLFASVADVAYDRADRIRCEICAVHQQRNGVAELKHLCVVVRFSPFVQIDAMSALRPSIEKDAS